MNKNKFIRQLINQYTLKNQIQSLLKFEKSGFGKIVMYENLIALSIIKLISDKNYLNIIKGKPLISSKVPLEEMTLGGLKNELLKYHFQRKLYILFERVIRLRNNISHNMFFKYKKIEELAKDVSKLVVSANKLVAMIDKNQYFLGTRIVKARIISKQIKAMRAFLNKSKKTE